MSNAYYNGTDHIFYSDNATNVVIKSPEGQNLIVEATIDGAATYPDIEPKQVLYKDSFTVDGNANFTFDNVNNVIYSYTVGGISSTDQKNKIYFGNTGTIYNSISNSGYHDLRVNDVTYMYISPTVISTSTYMRGVGGNSGSPAYGFNSSPNSGIFSESGTVATTCNGYTTLHAQSWETMIGNEAALTIGSFRFGGPVKTSLCIPTNGSICNILLGCGNNTSKNLMSFYNDFNHVIFGSIVSNNATSVSYTTASDRRLKYDIEDLPNTLQRVLSLRPRKFFWKNGFTEDLGFIADEVQEVVPNAVYGLPNSVDDEGKPNYQTLDQTKLIPLLVGSIKELNSMIDVLKSDIVKLNGDIDALYRRIL